MSNPKKDETKSGIQFFRIDKQGDIAPAFPNGQEPGAPKAEGSGSFGRLEPHFQDLGQIEHGPSANPPTPPAPTEKSSAAPLGELSHSAIPIEPQLGGDQSRIRLENEDEIARGLADALRPNPDLDTPLVPPPQPPTPAPVPSPLSIPLDPMEPSIQEASIRLKPPGSPSSAVQQQLDRLQPQVDSIARISPRQELSSDQVEILRKYISLKESEARDLKEQQRQYQSFLKKVTLQLETLTRRNRDLLSETELVKRREDKVRDELRSAKAKAQEELLTLRNDYEDRIRRGANVAAEVQDLERKREEWKEKVREDLKRIKLKERELENKYELLKRDTQALLDSKDKHVLELKKKNDALELEMETLESRLRKGNVVIAAVEQKKKRLIETMKLAINLLEQLDAAPEKSDDGDPLGKDE